MRRSKKSFVIFAHKQQHLSIDMKTKAVQHVPRINVSIWHFTLDSLHFTYMPLLSIDMKTDTQTQRHRHDQDLPNSWQKMAINWGWIFRHDFGEIPGGVNQCAQGTALGLAKRECFPQEHEGEPRSGSNFFWFKYVFYFILFTLYSRTGEDNSNRLDPL